MRASERKMQEIRAIADACADALKVVAKASQERQAKRHEARKALPKAR